MRLKHESVLLNESLDALSIKPNGTYVDATFGRGGHSREILKRLGDQGRLLVIDKDPEAIAAAEKEFGSDARVIICHGSFADLETFVKARDLLGTVDGLLFDLGVSSPQLDDADRGFSFLRDGPLDMRMDTTQGESAADWINSVDEQTLAMVLKEFGEERFAKRIARAIVKARDEKPITRTLALADIVAKANPAWEKHKHPATRSFQAVRIFLNNELNDLQNTLEQSLQVLKTTGRLVVISFHSLEDRLVKQFMRAKAKGPDIPRGLPVRDEDLAVHKQLKLVGKAIKASADELDENIRSRSAVLRVAEKI